MLYVSGGYECRCECVCVCGGGGGGGGGEFNIVMLLAC